MSAFYAGTVLFKRLLSCPRHWLRCRSECERYITSRKLKGVACAVLLASEFARMGAEVTVLDCDPNKSLSRWASHGMPKGVSLLGDIGRSEIVPSKTMPASATIIRSAPSLRPIWSIASSAREGRRADTPAPGAARPTPRPLAGNGQCVECSRLKESCKRVDARAFQPEASNDTNIVL